MIQKIQNISKWAALESFILAVLGFLTAWISFELLYIKVSIVATVSWIVFGFIFVASLTFLGICFLIEAVQNHKTN